MLDHDNIHNTNILEELLLPSPVDVKGKVPLEDDARAFVLSSRKTIHTILDRKDHRILLVVGPCSIHDTAAALEYAERLQRLAAEVQEQLFIVMRVYFEKPRTVVGWKGFINDPYLDDSFHIEHGLVLGRKLLRDITSLKVPIGTEALDPVVPQYLGDLISWTAIGARTTESQTHREMASGLSSPVGFKNGTDGSLEIAVNAVCSAASSHRFLGITQDGRSAVFTTRGNRYGHVVLRGGTKPNYDAESIKSCEALLNKHKLPANIMVDCSHGNSLKNPENQPAVFNHCLAQIEQGNGSIIGFMVESNLFGGRQDLGVNPKELRYGTSITDGCLSWDQTEAMIRDGAKRLEQVNRSQIRQ